MTSISIGFSSVLTRPTSRPVPYMRVIRDQYNAQAGAGIGTNRREGNRG